MLVSCVFVWAWCYLGYCCYQYPPLEEQPCPQGCRRCKENSNPPKRCPQELGLPTEPKPSELGGRGCGPTSNPKWKVVQPRDDCLAEVEVEDLVLWAWVPCKVSRVRHEIPDEFWSAWEVGDDKL